MVMIAVVALIFGYLQKFMFGIIAENITLGIRTALY